jgi:nitroimidazol reductase NimA-like FMN-containing flavoprotein (pyridoxamine 5'-phosphate oxidase superfamily)
MGFRDLDRQETEAVLERERVIRIAFSGDGEQYVVPVFYTWHEGALCGLTTPGRKTTMAAANPSVGFQIDSSATTGPWAWTSVSGQGSWETVPSPAEFGPFALALRAKLADSPPWAAQLLQERFAKLGMVAFRIRPTRLNGRAHEQE